MSIKALIVDLDDTIFPTNSIDKNLIKPFFNKLEEANDVLSMQEFTKAKEALWKRPFHEVAASFAFSDKMIFEGLETLNGMEFNLRIKPFDDYQYLRAIGKDQYLVTTGIRKLQMAKIEALGISGDFKEIFIDDPTVEAGGKLRVFKSILERYGYWSEELLVIGDNAESEIKAGQILGMHTLWINRSEEGNCAGNDRIKSFSEIAERLKA